MNSSLMDPGYQRGSGHHLPWPPPAPLHIWYLHITILQQSCQGDFAKLHNVLRDAPCMAFSFLKVPNSTFTLKTLCLWWRLDIRAGKILYRYQECLDPGPKSNNLMDPFLYFLHFDPVPLNFLSSFIYISWNICV